MRKGIIAALVAAMVVTTLFFGAFFFAPSEPSEVKALEKLRELIPDHEIQVTKERIVIPWFRTVPRTGR